MKTRILTALIAGATLVLGAKAAEYPKHDYMRLGPPVGWGTSYPCGIAASNVVGWLYKEPESLPEYISGFLYNGSTWSTLDAPGALYGTYPMGISGSNVVGYYNDGVKTHGFFYDGSTWSTLDAPDASATYPMGISGSNVVGYYNDGVKPHGFFYNGSTWSTLDAPGALNGTCPTGISGSNVVGYYNDGVKTRGFLYNGTTWSTLDNPNASETVPMGISGSNVVGYYNDGGRCHGFFYNGSGWMALDVPGGLAGTFARGISGSKIIGYYKLGKRHDQYSEIEEDYGFISTLETKALVWNNGLGYLSNGNEVTIYVYNGTNSSVVIPPTIGGLPVTTIEANAFANLRIVSLTIPDSVVNVGENFVWNSPNVTVNGSPSLIGYLAQNASALGFIDDNARTSIQNGGTASPLYSWIAKWLLSDSAFVSGLTQRILGEANNYGIAVKQNQSLNFPAIPPMTFAPGRKFTNKVTASSGLPVLQIVGNTAVAMISNNVLTILGAGSTTVTASQAGTALYNPASASQPLVVAPGNQTISFPAIKAQTLSTTNVLILSAVSSTKLPVSYIVANTAIATNRTSNSLTLLGIGTTTITATNAGTQNYSPAGAVQTLIVK